MLASQMTRALWQALEENAALPAPLSFQAEGGLPSTFAVTDLASASIAAAGLATAALLKRAGQAPGALQVDRRLASFWFAWTLRPQGWALPPMWGDIAGDYATRDGWIRLHTNASHHRAAVVRVLGPVASREEAAARVATWSKAELEHAVVATGGCAAEMRSIDEWKAHPQGQALAEQDLVWSQEQAIAPAPAWALAADRPLAGVRVLDLTRVLAGPVASRFLAGLGAEVLRIDPPGWDEPGVIPEVCLGKRCARLDLKDLPGRERFEELLRHTDVLIHGYRGDALENLGFDAEVRQDLAPGLVDVSLNAYGWSGPWRNRRGFDSLVQMSTGIAEAGMRWRQADKPVPLPVQALDHATGYLMAAAALCGLGRRLGSGRGSTWRLSLARTAQFLVEQGMRADALPALAEEAPADLGPAIETTAWGPAQRLRPPLLLEGTPLQWALPAAALGSSKPYWSFETAA
ncbi:CoA-transferase family III [Pseudomonas delhiensis]|uniref:CoA-transferase family III n=1 Tax=Pseudomonas delhiensis TaxID=366289 RepID=A0A239I648_9PSED|nr:CoA-transferase family III [Pseudomonas delhiensis]SNS89366.1 CoA-transferase family III [Pseudomonas delhiensis]